MPDQPQKMRYYVEVTEDEAKRFERAGTAKAVRGASGGSVGPHEDRQSPWLLMRTPAMQAEILAEGRGRL